MLSRTGFTLLEIVMLAIIIAIGGIIMMPRWNAFLHAWDVQNEAQLMKAKIRYAQQLAIQNPTEEYQVHFDYSGASDFYVVGYYDDFLIYHMVEAPIYLDNNIEIYATTPLDTVIFDEFGGVSNAPGYFAIYLDDPRLPDLYERELRVDEITGRVQNRKP